ncbi:hypothetical protein [Luteibacter flocculans]|uniref:hypothetical protein n=1 Tax=Luteibacter flocculans TaxID=2780091 RepID=UPI00202732B9|nr:hypothetical protein [Luteibacter flocculans]
MRQIRAHRMQVAVALLAIVGSVGVACATPAGNEPPPPSFGQATSSERLEGMTGGTNTTNNINQQTLNGTMSNTEASDTVSGGNVVSGTAFGNAAGLPTVIQNSGNNVLIQNSTIVTVRMNP